MKKLIYLFTIFSLIQISAQQTEKIGINKTENLRAEVDVNGTVSIEDTPEIKESYLPLYLNTDGNSRRLAAYKGVYRPFTILEMKIEPGFQSDYVKDFDTKIPTDKYELFLSDAYLANYKWEENISTFPNPVAYGIAHAFKNGDPGGPVYNLEQSVNLTKKDGTWHIAADYYGAEPYCKNVSDNNATCNYYYWNITVLAINKSFVYELGTYTAKDNEQGFNVLQTLINNHSTNQ